jgi:hypothetical protein
MIATTEVLMRRLIMEALSADEEIERTGEVYRAEDVLAWMIRLASGARAPRPEARQR